MSNLGYKRNYLRAPLRTFAIYEDFGRVYRGVTLNVSEGGLLMGHVDALPIRNHISLLVDIPIYPILNNFANTDIAKMNIKLFPRKIIRAHGEIVRKTELELGDGKFDRLIGLRYETIDQESKELIPNYIATFAKNIIHLLKTIESNSSRTEDIDSIRNIGKVMGYSEDLKVSLLHQKVLHDYQSLQWI